MKTKKLTEAQTACLALLNSKEHADFYDLMRVGANGSTTTKLVVLDLIALSESKENGKTWSINPAGREALSAGRYAVSQTKA